MINRAALILRYTQKAVDWINSVDPTDDMVISLEEANSDLTVYLVDEDENINPEKILKKGFLDFFENELGGWYTDETLWPADLTYKLFKSWFTPEFHSVIEDTGAYEIYDDEDD